jgi:SAM-dependent methyltransferase
VDIGCGPGFLLACLEKWFPNAELIGVDASDQLLDVAKSRCKAMKALKGDACSLPLADASVDVLFALHVVEHLPRPADFLHEAHRVLRPGGLLVMATPNPEGLGAKIMKQKWSGYSDPTHISLNGPPFWRQVLNGAGFQVTRDGTTGLSGIPVLNRMPIGLIHWVPSFFFGFYRWQLGEAYVCTAQRPAVNC